MSFSLPRCAAQLGVLAIATVAFVPQAFAMGAFAAGVPDDVARDGVAIGSSYNWGTQGEADQHALDECRTRNVAQSIKDLCKIVDRFQNRCIAVSLDPKAGTPGWGWAIADNSTLANDQALSVCRQTAGSDRAPYCTISFTDCDGSAK